MQRLCGDQIPNLPVTTQKILVERQHHKTDFKIAFHLRTRLMEAVAGQRNLVDAQGRTVAAIVEAARKAEADIGRELRFKEQAETSDGKQTEI